MVLSSLDAFVDGIPPKLVAELPLITNDLEDSWIQGAAQAPDTLKAHKALQRGLSACAAREVGCQPTRRLNASGTIFKSDSVAGFARLLSKNIEHTFGASLPKFSPDPIEYGDYSNAAFHAAVARGDQTYAFYRRSWDENRLFGVDGAMAAVTHGSTISRYLEDELTKLSKPGDLTRDLASFSRLKQLSESVVLGGWLRVAIGATGALAECVDLRTNTSWASHERPLAALSYQTLTDDDFVAFRSAYLWDGAYGSGYEEYGRPNATKAAGARSTRVLPAPRAAYAKDDALLIMLDIDDGGLFHESYGAPSTFWLRLDAPTPGQADVTVSLLNKTSTRYLESTYLSFDPSREGDWWLQKLGRWLNPAETAVGAGRNLHATDAVALSPLADDDSAALVITNAESALALFPGSAGPVPYPDLVDVDTSRGVAFPLLANGYWNTNYPTFLPFDAIHANYSFRFSLAFVQRGAGGVEN